MRIGLGHWGDRYRRVLAMSAKEIAERLKQQTIAHLDFVRYKSGVGFEPGLNGDNPGRDPKFFFSQEDVPQLCARLRDSFPLECDLVMTRADRICAHRFDLLGHKDLHFGSEIDWHCDRVHGKRAPRKPWFRIRYLDFAEVGDSKVTWELNRHQHFVTLAKAHRLSGDERFANELFSQWNHWHRENPYPIGINWASSLEVAFRSLSWLWAYFLMRGSPAMPAGFRDQLYRSLAVSGRHIECHLSTYFSPNTHLLGEGAALFFIGTLCPQLPPAERWQRLGWEILQKAAERQVRADGLHFEQSIYYHVYALDFFLHSAVLASCNSIPIPDEFNRTIKGMLEVLCALGQSGDVSRLGDDDGGRLFDPARNRTEHLLDPLATGAVMFSRGDFKTVAAGFREETLWLLGEAGWKEFNRLVQNPVRCGSTAFPSSGLYLLAGDDLQRQLTIDVGPQGTGHGHADALSITVNIGGRALLIDPGTFEYVGPNDSERDRFRGTAAHSTLVVDGQDQSEPKGPFSWANLPSVRAERWINGETFDLVVGSHDGYTRLSDPVVHRRTVFSLKSDFWLVRDQALGLGRHQLDLLWQINSELLPIQAPEGVFRGTEVGLRIMTPENCGWSKEVLSQEWSPAYGRKELHPVLHFSTVTTLPSEVVSLLLPEVAIDAGWANSPTSFTQSTGEFVFSCHLQTAQDDHCFFFGQGRPWSLGPWSSDGEFLYWHESRDGRKRTLIGCNVGYVEADGRRLISSHRSISRCEILSFADKVQISSSDPETVVDDGAFRSISVNRSHAQPKG